MNQFPRPLNESELIMSSVGISQRHTFQNLLGQINQEHVHQALLWLRANNPLYASILIDNAQSNQSPPTQSPLAQPPPTQSPLAQPPPTQSPLAQPLTQSITQSPLIQPQSHCITHSPTSASISDSEHNTDQSITEHESECFIESCMTL